MRKAIRRLRQSLVPLYSFVLCILGPGCSCEPTTARVVKHYGICKSQHAPFEVAPQLREKKVVPGNVAVELGVGTMGAVEATIPLVDDDLHISYDGENEGSVGYGFRIDGASVIQRCNKTTVLDGEQSEIRFDDTDFTSMCLDGKRLVVVSQTPTTNVYTIWPDKQIKVVGHFDDADDVHFETLWPSGAVTTYGKTAESRAMGPNHQVRAWLAGEKRDPRGNRTTYGWCIAENDDGTAAEYALDLVQTLPVGRAEPTQSITLVYGTKPPESIRQGFANGVPTQQSLQLNEVQVYSKKSLAERFVFGHEVGETSRRTRLATLERCDARGSCFAPTRFHYAKNDLGFDDVNTKIPAPLSDKASFLFADFTGDGLSDYVVGDMAPFSTPEHPVTQWRMAKNTGGDFVPETVAFLQEWSFQQNPEGPADPTLLQPELATVLPLGSKGQTSLLLHEIYGNRSNHVTLIPKADGTFEELDTGLARPFPVGPAPKGLRGSAGAVHLAAVTPDGVPSLIQCDDHGGPGQTNPSLPTWTLFLWKPTGFETTGTVINTLEGTPCGVEMVMADLHRSGIVELIVPGMVNVGGTPTTPTGTYHAHRRRSDGTWEVFDTKLRTPVAGGRVLFVDVNGDGLPDTLTSNGAGRILTSINTGKGFAAPVNGLDWDGVVAQDKYFQWAASADFDNDGRGDILLPMTDGASPTIPHWVILRAVGGFSSATFERVPTKIPLDVVLGETVTIADARPPRVGDFDGNGSPDVALFLGKELHIFRNRASDSDLLVGYSDGNNDHDPEDPDFVPNVSITYGHLIDDSKTKGQVAKDTDFYVSLSDPSNPCDYPRHCAVGSRRVVSEYALADGNGGVRRFGLRYRDGRYDRRGFGFLGFGKRYLTDLDTGATTLDIYDNEMTVKIGERDVYPLIGQVVEQWHWAPGLPTQPNPNQVEMAFAERKIDVVPTHGNASYFTLAIHTHTRRMQGTFSGAGTLESWVAGVATNENATKFRDSRVEVLDYDEFRNVLEVDVSTVGSDASMHVTRTVKNEVNKWMLGLPDTQTECSTGDGLTSCRTITRTVNEFGEVITESTSSSDALEDTKLFVTYEWDKFGNVTKTLADDAFGNHREGTTVYDDDGMYPVNHINALGHTTKTEYDEMLGVVKMVTDPNGLVTIFEHDGFGRLTQEKRPDGSSTTITRTREKLDGKWRLRQRTTTTGGADDEVIFDNDGRPLRTFSFGPQPEGRQAKRVMQLFQYDRLSGKLAKRSVPAAEGTTDKDLLFDEFEYDGLERPIRHTTPWKAVTTTSYAGGAIEVTDPLFQRTLTNLDALGRPLTVIDAHGKTTSYTYGPFSTLHNVTAPDNTVTSWKRDAFGRPIQINEPDRGTTRLKHNGFGDLLSSTDALGRTVTLARDALGRATSRTDTFAGKTLTTSWTWDKAPNGIGELHMVTSPDAIKTYSYSSKGQLEGMTLTVGNESFGVGAMYDAFGRARSVRYPQPLGVEPFEVTRQYDTHGFVVGVLDATSSDPYWQLTDVDAAGRYAKETFGNGVTTARSYFADKQTLKTITSTLGSSTIQQLSYMWDEQLNLKSRTDALQQQNKTERFRYDALDRLTCAYFGAVEDPMAPCVTSYGYAPSGNLINKSDVGAYSYTDPKHPHAVTNVPGVSYSYDAVGNQITRPGLVTIDYTPFDLPKTITQGANVVSFGYDGDEQRIRKTTSTSERLYVGDIFEQVTKGAAKEFVYYVHSPERVVAIVTRGANEPGTKWLHADHLGSVESVTNALGDVVEKRSYDAFGARRNPLWGLPGGMTSSGVTKGFTGHEEDEEVGLVNMKGRLYDPKLARFTTTDPVIADVWDGQSFNAYAYTWNNPLAFTDPSGFEAVDVWDEIIIIEPAPRPIPQPPVPTPSPPRDPPAVAPTRPIPVVEEENIGAYVPPIDVGTTGPGAPQTSSEGIGSFFDGLLLGNLSDNDSWSATAGSIVGGLIPGVGLAADIRDLAAAISHVSDGKDGAWLELGASIIGFVPGGDIAKGIAKGATKAATRAAVKASVELVDDAAKVLKGSTAAAADGLSSAQKTAGKVHAPRGPPGGSGPYSRLKDHSSVGPGKPTTQTQRRKVLSANEANNNGILRDDRTGEALVRPQMHRKGVTPPENEAHVDHVYPRSKGGANSFPNLEVRSRRNNLVKSDKVE
ncbi:MAG TPA: RHS repeat-associated core domain-containing protein [Polyangium sp.]|nr:RHS repeat-associated core domain-containing protein [Polyangium sp.]